MAQPLVHSPLQVVRAGLIAALTLGGAAVATAQPGGAAPQCQPAPPLMRIPELPEASGVAVSRRSPGRFWAHNDSGEPVLVALDARGSVTGRVRLEGAQVEDWESVAAGACPEGSCLYVGDIGDNDAERKQITVYRVPEPSSEESIAVKDVFHARYPDGAHDAEALLVAPDGGLFIVTKGETGPVGLYRFPRELRPGQVHQLERVGQPRGSAPGSKAERITDGAVSTDGTWIVLRTTESLSFHRAADLLAGNWREAKRVDLRAIGEPQGEGVAIAADGTVYLTGEGGEKSQPGTFARLACSVPSQDQADHAPVMLTGAFAR